MNENALGMSLNNAFNTRNVDLGIELRAVQSAAMALYPALTGKLCHSNFDDLRPGKVDLQFIVTARITPNTTASNFIMAILP